MQASVNSSLEGINMSTTNNQSSNSNPYKDLFVGRSGENSNQQQQQQNPQGANEQQNQHGQPSYDEQVNQFVQEAKSSVQEGALLQSQGQNNQQNDGQNQQQ